MTNVSIAFVVRTDLPANRNAQVYQNIRRTNSVLAARRIEELQSLAIECNVSDYSCRTDMFANQDAVRTMVEITAQFGMYAETFMRLAKELEFEKHIEAAKEQRSEL